MPCLETMAVTWKSGTLTMMMAMFMVLAMVLLVDRLKDDGEIVAEDTGGMEQPVESELSEVSTPFLPAQNRFVLPLKMAKTTRVVGALSELLQLGNAPHEEPLANFQNTVFFAEVDLGTPPAPFAVVLDTGSFVMWVPDNVCQSLACQNHRRFSVHNSSTGEILGQMHQGGNTYVQAGQLEYGTGTMTGVQVSDAVQLAGVDIPDVAFLVSTKEADQPFAAAPFDGIIGIGRGTQEIKDSNGHSKQFNVLKAAYDAHKIDQNVISFYLSKEQTTVQGQNAGAVVVGGVDEQFFEGDITWHPVVEHGPPMWTIDLLSLTVGNNTNLCAKGCVAVVDTGTSLLVTAMADAINAQIGVAKDCTNYGTAPDVVFKFSGNDREYSLPAHAVTFKAEDEAGNTLCQPAIMAMDGQAAGAIQESFSLPNEEKDASLVAPEGPAARKLLDYGYSDSTPKMPPAGSKWDKISSMFGGKEIIILGDIFMRHHYAAFDNSDLKNAKVGFAKAKHADLESVFATAR